MTFWEALREANKYVAEHRIELGDSFEIFVRFGNRAVIISTTKEQGVKICCEQKDVDDKFYRDQIYYISDNLTMTDGWIFEITKKQDVIIYRGNQT